MSLLQPSADLRWTRRTRSPAVRLIFKAIQDASCSQRMIEGNLKYLELDEIGHLHSPIRITVYAACDKQQNMPAKGEQISSKHPGASFLGPRRFAE